MYIRIFAIDNLKGVTIMSKKVRTLLSTLLLVALFATLVPSAFAASDILIGIPDDATNGGRAIKLLETVGLIEVNPDAGWTPELKDITKYLYNIEIMPTQANTLPATLDDFGASTINGTYAIPTGLVPSRDGLAIESQASATTESGNPFVNVVVARTADKDNELYKTIQTAFQSDSPLTRCAPHDGSIFDGWTPQSFSV